MMKPEAFATRWLLCGVFLMLGCTPGALGARRSAPRGNALANADDGAAARAAEQSRDAGLLTDWHLIGSYGRGEAAEMARAFDPERQATEQAAKDSKRTPSDSNDSTVPGRLPGQRRMPKLRFELMFPEGTFTVPEYMAARPGVLYAVSCVYLSDDGEWNLYLESPGEAIVFVDGVRVLTRTRSQTGAQRETIHANSGYHTVMVKFLPQAAPFRVAILPPNSGSRRKNNTPHLHGAAENLNALLRRPSLTPEFLR